MKYIVLISGILALSFSIIQNKVSNNSKAEFARLQQSGIQDEKIKIKKEELPEATRKTLEGDAFKGWTISQAYKLKNGEFEVELRKGETSQSIKFDKDGKIK